MVIGGFAFRGRPGILEPSLSFFLLARLIQGAGVLGPTSLARRLVPLRRPGQCPERLCRRPDALPSVGIRRRRTCHRLLRLALCRFTNPLGGACLRLSHSFPGSGSGASDPRAEKNVLLGALLFRRGFSAGSGRWAGSPSAKVRHDRDEPAAFSLDLKRRLVDRRLHSDPVIFPA